jgi:hypothetical protein
MTREVTVGRVIELQSTTGEVGVRADLPGDGFSWWCSAQRCEMAHKYRLRASRTMSPALIPTHR